MDGDSKEESSWESVRLGVFLVTKGMGAGASRRDTVYFCNPPTYMLGNRVGFGMSKTRFSF